jgi:hypothetical protein
MDGRVDMKVKIQYVNRIPEDSDEKWVGTSEFPPMLLYVLAVDTDYDVVAQIEADETGAVDWADFVNTINCINSSVKRVLK